MGMIRKLISAYITTLIMGLLFPLVSPSAVPNTTYEIPCVGTTQAAIITEHTTITETAWQSMPSSQSQALSGLIRLLFAPKTGQSFFQNTKYTDKVLEQMKGGAGEFHSFPESVRAFENAGSIKTITGGDGLVREMLEIPGSYSTSSGVWKDGMFQFMKEADGAINHRLFVPTTP